MTEWRTASAERPRDLYGLLVWLAAPLQPAARALPVSARLVIGTSASREEQTALRRLMLAALAFGVGATAMVALGAVPAHLIDFSAGTLPNWLFFSEFGRVFWRVMEIPKKPLLWLGLGAGILIRLAYEKREGPIHSFLFTKDSGDARLVRLLATLLVLAIITHFTASFGRALVSFISSSLHPQGGGVALNLELAISGFLGLIPFSFEPREYPPLSLIVLQATTLHVGQVMDLWAWSAVLVLLFLRLPSIAASIVVCFGAVLVLSCLGMLEVYGSGIATLRLPFADAVLQQLSDQIAKDLGLPWWQVAAPLYRLEAILMAVIVLWIVGAIGRRWLEEVP